MTADPLAYLHAAHTAAQAEAEAARDVDYARCGVWEARGPYPAASGEADGVLRPRGNLRAEISKDNIFVDAELPWDLIPHMARHDPAAVLRRITAERKILARHQDDGHSDCTTCGTDGGAVEVNGITYTARDSVTFPCPTVRDLAEAWGWTPDQ